MSAMIVHNSCTCNYLVRKFTNLVCFNPETLYYIAHNLKFLRRKHRLSFNDIADKTSIHKSTIASYEYGKAKPKEGALKKLAELFAVNAEDLMFKNIERHTGLSHTDKDIKGDSNHTNKYVHSTRTQHPLPMSTMLAMSIADLLELKKMQDDVDYVKSITEIITYKQECEHLKIQNELLQARISDKDQTILAKDETIRAYQIKKAK